MPIPGCENYNAEYFADKKMSIKCNTLDDVIENIKKLIVDENIQKEMINNQKKYMHKNTCDKIAEIILKIKEN